jgi:hypothetical protein
VANGICLYKFNVNAKERLSLVTGNGLDVLAVVTLEARGCFARVQSLQCHAKKGTKPFQEHYSVWETVGNGLSSLNVQESMARLPRSINPLRIYGSEWVWGQGYEHIFQNCTMFYQHFMIFSLQYSLMTIAILIFCQ